jgi:hypothetical protein
MNRLFPVAAQIVRLRMVGLSVLALSVASLAACKVDSTVDYDAEYKVTVKSLITDDGALSTDCVDAARNYNQNFTYQLVFTEADVTIDIEGEGFATGTRSGCLLNYQSAVWLEEESSGDVRWQITGQATYEGVTDGCDLPDDIDWEGTETIEIVESEDEDVPAGCTYDMETEGTFIGG